MKSCRQCNATKELATTTSTKSVGLDVAKLCKNGEGHPFYMMWPHSHATHFHPEEGKDNKFL
jgi:hypothetical protein